MAKIYDFGSKGKFKVLDDGSVQQMVGGKWQTMPGVEVRGNAVYVQGKRFGALSGSGGQVNYSAQGKTAIGSVSTAGSRKTATPPPVGPGVQRGYTGPYVDVGGVTTPEYAMNFRSPSGHRTMQTSEGRQLFGSTVEFANGERFNVAPNGVVRDAKGAVVGQVVITPSGAAFRDANGQLHFIGMGQNGPVLRIGGQEQTFRVVDRQAGSAAPVQVPSASAQPVSQVPSAPANQSVPTPGTTAPLVFDFGDNGIFRLDPNGSVFQWAGDTWSRLPSITVQGGQVLQNGQPLGQLSFGANGALFRMGDQVATGRTVPLDQWSAPSPAPVPEINPAPTEPWPVNLTPPANSTIVPGPNPFPISFGGLPLPGGASAPHATVGAADLAAQQGRMIPASFVLGQTSGNPYAGIWGFLNGDAFAITGSGDVYQWDQNTGLLSAMQGVKVTPNGTVQMPQGSGMISMMPTGEMVFDLNGQANIGYRAG